jgi:formylmethanofuran dehydrogenase subunit E
MEANAYLCDLCQEFSRQRQLVRVEVSEVSNLILSAVYQPSSGCTYGKRIQHFPSYGHHRESVGSRDQSKLQVRCSKHIVHHREQISPGVKVEQHGGMESLQIYLGE